MTASTIPAALARDGRGRHGVQLALAVFAAYAVSAWFGLPESLWAVMSALIVVRPNTGTTLIAGWTRLAGTVFGTLAGIAGVWLQHRGAGLPAVTLVVVAALAFASAVVPIFASAPIAALIVLSSTAIPGHSVLQVAALRSVEVGIGVATGVLVSLVLRGAGAAARFDAACAVLLCRFAALLGARDSASTIETETRTKLRELAVLAAGADTEVRWLRRERSADRHRKVAALLARLFQDVAVLGRLLPAEPADPARIAARAALEQAERIWTRQAPLDITAPAGIDPALAAPLQLLSDDLRLLLRLRAR
jgi:uncharacterized membrane protein YccC